MAPRWPRAVAALLLAAGAASVGALTLLSGPASATTEAATCGVVLKPPCPPSATVTATSDEMSGTITVTWTPTSSGDTMFVGNPTLVWTPQASGAPNPVTIPNTEPQSLGACSANNNAGVLVCTYSWPPSLLANGYVLNGTYTVAASGKECPAIGLVQGLCSAPMSVSQPLGVQNPAVAPAGAKAVLVPGSNPQTIQVSWTPNPEPDIVGYEVFSGTSTTAFCSVAANAAHPVTYSCTGTPTTNGTYSFHVVAYRYGSVFSAQVGKQIASAASTATANLTVSGITGTVTTVPASNTLGNIGIVGTKPSTTHTSGTIIIAAPSAPLITTTTLGGDFSPVLPYGTTTSGPTSSTDDPAAITVPAHHKGSSVATVAAVGAGLLIATIALHGVWLRSEVRRGGQLEPLDPETFSRR